jgi:hypothetical protein
MLVAGQSSSRHNPQEKEDQENHQEYEEQEFGDGKGSAGNPGETQNSRNQSQNQKQQSQPEHRNHLKEAAFPNEGRGQEFRPPGPKLTGYRAPRPQVARKLCEILRRFAYSCRINGGTGLLEAFTFS